MNHTVTACDKGCPACRRPGRLKTAFNECDQNKSGSIDAEDLARVVEKILPFVPSDEQLSVFRYETTWAQSAPMGPSSVSYINAYCSNIQGEDRAPQALSMQADDGHKWYQRIHSARCTECSRRMQGHCE